MILVKILLVLLATVLSGILYRLGGAARIGDWLDVLKHSKTRDWGCSLIVVALMLAQPIVWWIHVIVFILMWTALSTYWDDLFGYDNYGFHGLVIGLACFPYAIVIGGWIWLWFIVRALIMGFFMKYWCKVNTNDVKEEVGRGSIIAFTVPLLWI